MRSSVKSYRGKSAADRSVGARQSAGNRRADRMSYQRGLPSYNRLPAVGLNSVSAFQPNRGPEKKVIDASTTGSFVAAQSTWVTPVLMNGIANGVEYNERTGRQVTLKSLYWQWAASFGSTSAGTSPVRLLIVYDKEANGALPAVTDVLNADSITSPNNLNNRDRFIVLVDEIVGELGSAGPQSFYRKGYRKLGLPMVFNSTTTATITAIQSGSIFAMTCQNGNIITLAPTSSLRVRCRFVDN